jgi:hypothetical protein
VGFACYQPVSGVGVRRVVVVGLRPLVCWLHLLLVAFPRSCRGFEFDQTHIAGSLLGLPCARHDLEPVLKGCPSSFWWVVVGLGCASRCGARVRCGPGVVRRSEVRDRRTSSGSALRGAGALSHLTTPRFGGEVGAAARGVGCRQGRGPSRREQSPVGLRSARLPGGCRGPLKSVDPGAVTPGPAQHEKERFSCP